MAKQFPRLEPAHRELIRRQHVFFVASATSDSRINVSPKGLDCLRIIDDLTVCYRDLTGSGSETASHLRADGRLTFMFCAFEGKPVILRLFGRGVSHPAGSAGYVALLEQWYGGDAPLGTRQIIEMRIDLVQTSCGFAVPLLDFVGERDTLARWAEAKGPDGLEAYRLEKNRTSIDGLNTGFFSD